jgi:hypothetical protein
MFEESIEFLLIASSLYVGFKVYNNFITGRGVVDSINESLTNFKVKTQETLNKVSFSRKPIDSKINTGSVLTKIKNQSSINVLNLSSKQKITIEQSGNHKLPFFGIFLEGKALFEFDCMFNGSVEFSTKDISLEQIEDCLFVTIKKPIISVTEVKIDSAKDSGNLSKQLLARTKVEEILEQQENFIYLYNLFFYSTDNGENLIDKIYFRSEANIKESMKAFIQNILLELKPEVQYSITLKVEGKPSEIVLEKANGQIEFIPLESIENVKLEDLEKIFDENAKSSIKIQKIDGYLKNKSYNNQINLNQI